MLTIEKISDSNLVLVDNDIGYRGVFYNTDIERGIVESKLSDTNLWNELVLPKWGDTPKINNNLSIDINNLRKIKQTQIKQTCHNKIVEGISIDLGLTDEEDNALGELHYTLSEKNQTDMRDLASMIAQGATQVTWRDDSRVSHMVYTSEQFMNLYTVSMQYILKCRFQSDALEELLFSYTDDQVDLISAINWDTELPDNIKTKMDNLLSVMLTDTSE